jgi:hypothetical protein
MEASVRESYSPYSCLSDEGLLGRSVLFSIKLEIAYINKRRSSRRSDPPHREMLCDLKIHAFTLSSTFHFPKL